MTWRRFTEAWVLAVLLLCIFGSPACDRIEIPPCVLDGTCIPTPTPRPTPVGTPHPDPTPTPTARPTPTPSPTPTAVPTPVPTPTPSPVATPTPRPEPCRIACPATAWHPRDKAINQIGHGSWLPWFAADGTGPRQVNTPRGIESGAPGHRLKGRYGCHPAPEVPGCTPTACADLHGNLVDCNTWQITGPAENGWDGAWPEVICEPREVSCPSPPPSPIPTPPPGGRRPLLRIGASAHACQYRAEGQTKLVINFTPRVQRHPGDARGEEQPRPEQDARGAICTQAGPGWSGFDEMEHSTGPDGNPQPYLCHSVLPPGTYTFRGCPQPDLPLADPNVPPCSESVVRIDSYGFATCLSGCANYWKDGECQGSPRAAAPVELDVRWIAAARMEPESVLRHVDAMSARRIEGCGCHTPPGQR